MNAVLRKVGACAVFLRHLDRTYLVRGMQLLFLQTSFYLLRLIRGDDAARRKFSARSVEVSVDTIKFSVPAAPNDLGYICECFLNRSYEAVRLFRPCDGDICVDVGANIGSCVLRWFRSNPTGRMICFEPHPETCKRLQVNIGLNNCRNIEVFPFALSDVCASIAMYESHGSSMAVVVSSADSVVRMVQSRSLDRMVEELALTKISLCKIDVEGHEVHVLQGAARSLPLVERLVIECHSQESRSRVKELLSKDFSIIQQDSALPGLIFAVNITRSHHEC